MKNLMNEISLGSIKLSNRIVMAPMTRGRATAEGVPNQKMADYYRQRATAGLIITEATHISPQAVGWEQAPGIYSPEQVEGWKKVAEAVHDEGGKIYLQLWHTGRASHSYYQPQGEAPVSASPIPKDEGDPVMSDHGKLDPEVPHALDSDEIDLVLEDYRKAAKNAKAAGFDGVEIHAGNGYLIDQFLRDGVNQRDDEYGGSVANRTRFLKQTLEEVLTVWENDRVGVRISPTNPFNSMEDSDPVALYTHVAELLNFYKISYLHVLEARPNMDHPMSRDDVPYVAPKIRKRFDGNIILNAGYDQESGDEAIANDHADMIAFGVPFLANPDLVQRFEENAPLNKPDEDTFYTHEREGYTDYPTLSEQTEEKAEDYKTKHEQTLQVALVTGASSGIGKAAALDLAQRGFYVFATSRDKSKLAPIQSDNIEPLQLDLTDEDSRQKAFRHIVVTKGRIDVLVNNAGYGSFGVIEGMSEAEARRQFDVNVFGAMEVTRATLPIMRRQRSGKIIQLASVVSDISMPVGGWYSASKHAISALMDALRIEVEPFGISVSMIKPGPIDSGFEKTAMEALEEVDAPDDYLPMIRSFKKSFRKSYEDCPGPETVIEALDKILETDNPKANYTDTTQSNLAIKAKHILPDAVFDGVVRQVLKNS